MTHFTVDALLLPLSLLADKDFAQLAQLPSAPPTATFFVLHAIMLILEESDTSWPAAKKTLSQRGTLKRLKDFCVVKRGVVERSRSRHGLLALLKHPDVKESEVCKQGGDLLVALLAWVTAVCAFNPPYL